MVFVGPSGRGSGRSAGDVRWFGGRSKAVHIRRRFRIVGETTVARFSGSVIVVPKGIVVPNRCVKLSFSLEARIVHGLVGRRQC